MSKECAFCGGPVNPFDKGTWKEVTGWVGGPKKDSMRLRVNTERYAHTGCVMKQVEGQAPEQLSMLDDSQASEIFDDDVALLEEMKNNEDD